MPRMQADELLRRARQAYQDKLLLPALRFAEEAAFVEPTLAGVHVHRARVLADIGRFADALAATDEELRHHPGDAQAMQLRAALLDHVEKVNANRPAREAATVMSTEVIREVERATHRYTYRGHAMIKNPFDMALYPLLLWNLKPATIFEIGSYNGASALWMADLLTSYGVDFHIHSLDIVKVTAIQHPHVTFYEGSGRALNGVFPAEMIAACPRPFLVIDDADHMYPTCKAILEHFHPHMRAGEYLIMEDGLTVPDPRRASEEFLAQHPSEWMIDGEYCDFFGYNATWCINGFLKRIA
jgi:cephalosporin hydroxylase